MHCRSVHSWDNTTESIKHVKRSLHMACCANACDWPKLVALFIGKNKATVYPNYKCVGMALHLWTTTVHMSLMHMSCCLTCKQTY